MMQGDTAIELGVAAIPGGGVGEVSAHEGGDVADGVVREPSRDHVADDHVAIGLELLAVV